MQALKGGYEEALAKLNLEMSQVRDVQESLLPEYPPEIEGLDFACEYLPSGHASGDYYDFLTPTEELVGSFVADVSGHGAPSAVVMAITRVLVQEHLRSTQSAGEALSKINSLPGLHRQIRFHIFAQNPVGNGVQGIVARPDIGDDKSPFFISLAPELIVFGVKLPANFPVFLRSGLSDGVIRRG